LNHLKHIIKKKQGEEKGGKKEGGEKKEGKKRIPPIQTNDF